MAYIANAPVRFNRNYEIGETVPTDVIDPSMVRRLVDMGKIVEVDIPNSEEGTPAGDGGQEFKCDVCGKSFASAGALTSHARAHKKQVIAQ